jgi:hypothetical protein
MVDFNGACPASWGVPAVAGGVYGGKPYSDFCLVWEPTCADGTKSAFLNMEFAGGPNEVLIIKHLDGMSNLDSFNVQVDGNSVGSYSDVKDSTENWVTTSFPVNVPAGIHTVTLQATDPAWDQCDSWGQIAVDYIKVDECGGGISFGDGWADCAVTGSNYGGISKGTCCKVAWNGVTQACTEPTRDAAFNVGAADMVTSQIIINHLDGIAETGDGFEVKDGDNVLCTYAGTMSGTETWKTLTCDVNLIGVKTLTLHPTATGPWTQCNTYGQVAISSITFEAATAPIGIDFRAGDTCPTSWGVPAVLGGVYGGKPYSDFCLVWEPTCTPETKTAFVNLEFAGGANELITINHLDGMSDLDSFDVLVDNVVKGHYADSLLPTEDWVTTSFPVTVTPGIHTVTLKATDNAWSGCDSWGQIAIDSIKVEEPCTLITSYRDADGDGYGNNAVSSLACTVPNGYVKDNTDCNDANAAVHPGAIEVCNGVDDDCSAATADGSSESWFNQATSCGLGECASTGAFVCTAGVKTDTCKAGTPALTDTNCNGKDDNCNGQTDEGYLPDISCFKPGACAAGNLASSCLSGVETGCKTGTLKPETCNGIDDNCNGLIDDGLTAPVQSCSVGVGACKATGTKTKTCNGVSNWSSWGTCSPIAGTPKPETCDNIDNDCNGKVDDGLTKPADNVKGLCSANTQKCKAGTWSDNSINYKPKPEVCDNKDNDCDGLVDESLTRTTHCGLGICSGNTGKETCTAGTWGGNTCNPLAGVKTEVCDDKDNNCNGQVDELPFCTAAEYCSSKNIRSIGDILGRLICTMADWQNNEYNWFPNDCRVNLVGSGNSLTAVCIATPNAN